MVTQQLLDYIHQQTGLGKSKEEIASALLAAGWKPDDVNQALNNPAGANGVPIPTAVEFPSAGKIFNEAWALYKTRFKTLIAISLIPFLCFLIIGFIFGVGYISLKISSNTGSLSMPLIYIIGLVVAIFLIYVAIWGSTASLFAIKDSAEAIGWKESFRRSRPYIGAFFTTGLLSGLAVLGGFILFIIPGIIFGLWFSQSPYVVIEEGLNNTAALKRSKYYIKGRIGQIFGKLFYIGIITIALYIALGIILAIFGSFAGLKYDSLSWISNIFSIIWTPVVTVYGYLVYKYSKSTRP